MAFGSNIDQRKKNKKNHVVDLFRRNELLSKIQARKLSGYSMNTILTIFDALLDEKLIFEAQGEQKPLGRKATFFRLSDRKVLYLGVTFNQSGIYSSLVSFSRATVESHFTKVKPDIARDAFIQVLGKHVEEVLGRNGQYRQNCVAVGIAVPGDIDTASGILRSYTLMPRLNGINFLDVARNVLPKRRAIVDHNIRSMTSYFLMDRELVEGAETILFVSARSGAANGIISRGSIVTAHGEFGHVRVSDEPVKCICGRTGCLDGYFSYNSFVELLKQKAGPYFTDVGGAGDMTALGILRGRYRDGDGEMRRELDSRLDKFALALHDVINVTVPDLVILSGELFGVYDDPGESVKKALARCFPDSGYVPHVKHARIIFRDLGTDIASLGICHGMIEEDWGFQSLGDVDGD